MACRIGGLSDCPRTFYLVGALDRNFTAQMKRVIDSLHASPPYYRRIKTSRTDEHLMPLLFTHRPCLYARHWMGHRPCTDRHGFHPVPVSGSYPIPVSFSQSHRHPNPPPTAQMRHVTTGLPPCIQQWIDEAGASGDCTRHVNGWWRIARTMDCRHAWPVPNSWWSTRMRCYWGQEHLYA